MYVHTEADKAKEKMMQEKLQREKLAGDKDVAGKNYESEGAAYKLTISPYEREIYVITVCALPTLLAPPRLFLCLFYDFFMYCGTL